MAEEATMPGATIVVTVTATAVIAATTALAATVLITIKVTSVTAATEATEATATPANAFLPLSFPVVVLRNVPRLRGIVQSQELIV